MASIYKRKDTKVWYVTYYMNGRRISEKVGSNKKAAQYRRNEIELQLVKGERPINSERPISELMSKYKVHLDTRPYSKRYHDRISNYFNNIQKYLSKRAIERVEEVTYEFLDQYLTYRIRDNSISHKTANGELDFVRNMLDYAIELGYLKVNPASKLKRFKVVKKPPRYYSEEELKVIFSKPGDYEMYFMTLLHTGLRAGDAANLSWGNIDLGLGYIRVTMQKTNLTVTIPISSELRKSLLDHTRSEGRIFNGIETDERRQKVREYLKKIFNEAELDSTGIGLHTFRHTFATRLIMNRVPLIQISKWLGHTSISMTQIYSHLEPTSGQDDIEKINFSKEKIATSELREILNAPKPLINKAIKNV